MSRSVQSVDRLDCTGCGVCVASCACAAITLSYDNEGFFSPQIDEELCTLCGRCRDLCPAVREAAKHQQGKYYILQLRDKTDLRESASGGAFFGLASCVINQGGVVCGCQLGADMLPVHVCAENLAGIRKMQGSKYVQSAISNNTYHQIGKYLSDGRTVLFSGTPCQVAALYGFVGACDNLITIDLVCHGVASPGVFFHYLKTKEREFGESVTKVKFRCKEVGVYPNNHSLHLETESATHCRHALKDPFGSSFYHNRILRECCYRCRFATKERVADLTLGDYGEKDTSLFSSKDGYSFVSANTHQGVILLDVASHYFEAADLRDDYTQVNLRHPTIRPSARDAMGSMSFDVGEPLADMGFNLKITAADRIKRFVPQGLKDEIKMLLSKRK